jgi:hypothetical protein
MGISIAVFSGVFGPVLSWPYWPYAVPVGLVVAGLATVHWSQQQVAHNLGRPMEPSSNVNPKPTIADPDFDITRMSSLVGTNSKSWVFVCDYIAHGPALYPANAAVFVYVLNRRDYPLTVQGVKAEVLRSDGKWVAIERLPTGDAGGQIFAGTDLSKQFPQPPELDFGYKSQQAIPARATMDGWLLFQYPRDLEASVPVQVRVTLWNDYKNQTTFSGANVQSQGNAIGGGATLVFNTKEQDLSKAPVSLWNRDH